MTPQEMIAEQLKRIETLQKEFQNPKLGQDDIKIADNLRADRAQALRKNLQSLERQRTETVARFDAEIARIKDRIAALEKAGELEFAQQLSGSGTAKRPRRAPKRRQAATKASGRTKK